MWQWWRTGGPRAGRAHIRQELGSLGSIWLMALGSLVMRRHVSRVRRLGPGWLERSAMLCPVPCEGKSKAIDERRLSQLKPRAYRTQGRAPCPNRPTLATLVFGSSARVHEPGEPRSVQERPGAFGEKRGR